MSYKFPQQCSKACTNGNAYRGYLCQCNKCNGKLHGAVSINFKMLEEIIDRKLLDPTMGKADWQRWHAIMQALLTANSSRRLRRVA